MCVKAEMYVCERRMYVCESARMNYGLNGPSYIGTYTYTHTYMHTYAYVHKMQLLQIYK